ncbi:BBS2 [Bugula neritina]|uniref:BBS2 n=1 Tax=Bugula neritina TaxID=10212 RepID=A0A7J7IVY3_BUGNE|nr:BBS2 [Bugula neritina]
MDASNQVSILTTNMNTAGEILQSLASFLNIEHLNVQADFKHEMKELGEILTKVDEYHTVRQRLTADMADHSNLIKSMVVRAEDARLMDDLGSMKKYYMEFYLKQVNQYIQKAGKLRVGKYKTQVIADCRASVKNNNVAALFKIIKTGMCDTRTSQHICWKWRIYNPPVNLVIIPHLLIPCQVTAPHHCLY